MSNVICSLCRGDHTYEEHMQTERDLLELSVERHQAGKHPSQTLHLLSWDNGKNSQGDDHTPHCASKMEALGIGCTCLNGEDAPPSPVLDHAWRTIPRDQPGVTPAPEPPVLAPRAAPYRSLLTPANIATAASIAALIVMSTGIVLAWFLDWKLP